MLKAFIKHPSLPARCSVSYREAVVKAAASETDAGLMTHPGFPSVKQCCVPSCSTARGTSGIKQAVCQGWGQDTVSTQLVAAIIVIVENDGGRAMDECLLQWGGGAS